MATVTLKGVKKIYPHSNDDKKKKKKAGDAPSKKTNLQITDKEIGRASCRERVSINV